jgi:hypothetical protein
VAVDPVDRAHDDVRMAEQRGCGDGPRDDHGQDRQQYPFSRTTADQASRERHHGQGREGEGT